MNCVVEIRALISAVVKDLDERDKMLRYLQFKRQRNLFLHHPLTVAVLRAEFTHGHCDTVPIDSLDLGTKDPEQRKEEERSMAAASHRCNPAVGVPGAGYSQDSHRCNRVR